MDQEELQQIHFFLNSLFVDVGLCRISHIIYDNCIVVLPL